MSYIINKSDGNILTTIVDGTSNETSTSLTLVGQNYVGWGEIFQENLVHILESFNNTTAPAHPLIGQLWFNTTSKSLSVYAAETVWKPLAASTSSLTQPQSPSIGDFWYDHATKQLKVWDSAKWQVVGPVYSFNQGATGANAVTILDSVATARDVVTLEVNNITQAIFSPHSGFTPDTAIEGFDSIKKGFNLQSTFGANAVSYHGTAQNAITLQGLEPGVFFRTDSDQVLNGNLYIRDDDGLWLGSQNELKIFYDNPTDTVNARVAKEATNFKLSGTSNNVEMVLLQSTMATGLLTVRDAPTADLGIATKGYVDTTVGAAETRVRGFLQSNVLAINNTLGILTTEINTVNNLANNNFLIKSNIASPVFTGVPRAPTAGLGTNTTQLATTAFVRSEIDRLATITDENTQAIVVTLDDFALKAGPTFTGIPRAPTAALGTNTTQLATTAFVVSENNAQTNSLSAIIALNAPQNSPTFTGIPAAPTAPLGTVSTQIATTSFVQTAIGAAVLAAPTGIPPGGIIIWSGSTTAIPAGWVLCNGANSTPDLRDRFVIGAGTSYAVNATGGNKDAIVVNHTHSVSDPGHVHTTVQMIGNNNIDGVDSTTVQSGDHHNEGRNTGSAVTGISIAAAGAPGTNANLPPYYALCYIMKTA